MKRDPSSEAEEQTTNKGAVDTTSLVSVKPLEESFHTGEQRCSRSKRH